MIGTWTNAQYGVTMVLNQDGCYVFQGPQGQSSGRWGAQGNTFWMQDAMGQVIYYTVQVLTSTQGSPSYMGTARTGSVTAGRSYEFHCRNWWRCAVHTSSGSRSVL